MGNEDRDSLLTLLDLATQLLPLPIAGDPSRIRTLGEDKSDVRRTVRVEPCHGGEIGSKALTAENRVNSRLKRLQGCLQLIALLSLSWLWCMLPS